MDYLKEKFSIFKKTGKINDYLDYVSLKKEKLVDNRRTNTNGIKRRDNS